MSKRARTEEVGRPCRACGGHGAQQIIVMASKRGLTREWHAVVCRACWRAWEAMLDAGSPYTQPALGNEALPWFW